VSVGGSGVAVAVAVAVPVVVAVVVGVLEDVGEAAGEAAGSEAGTCVLSVEAGVGDGTGPPSPPLRLRTRYSPARTRATTAMAPRSAHTGSRRLASGRTAAISLSCAASGSVAAL
jgi:hypothetical protein